MLMEQNSGPSATQVTGNVIGSKSGTRSLWQKLGRGWASWPGGGGLAHVKATKLGVTYKWEGATQGQRVLQTVGMGQVTKAGSTGMENKDGRMSLVRMTGQWLQGSGSL